MLQYVLLVFVAYVVSAFLAHPRWGDVLKATLLPHFTLVPVYTAGALALLGTTLTSYAYVWEDDRTGRRAARSSAAWLRETGRGHRHGFGRRHRLVHRCQHRSDAGRPSQTRRNGPRRRSGLRSARRPLFLGLVRRGTAGISGLGGSSIGRHERLRHGGDVRLAPQFG
ncbi:MAG: divalent metal cation transporter [Candidatus Eremiobacteraeota bacterium]|nr:divalent metal cation transporter [Candidatus Eremiobacteraeota bacterium]MBC5827561.1 divalent metal cation transporter [Candidatus Eremiobacteraeota bacterium]